jgi:hypothetical protein
MEPNKTKCIWIACIAAVAVCTMRAGPPLPGAVWTTDPTCSGVDLNIYSSKGDVYLNGGPNHPGALPDGSYYVQVTDPSGACVLGTSVGSGNPTPFVVTNGVGNCIQLCTVLTNGPGTCAANGVDPNCGYNDTTNPGGEYKAWVSLVDTFDNNSTKTDNFKVRPSSSPPPMAALCVNKFYDANVNGLDDDGQQINGWKYQVLANDNLIIDAETYHCSVVDPDTFHVIEGTPVESSWFHTTPSAVDITVAEGETKTVDFGNVCVGGGTNARTIGFWSNKNGQNLETQSDFTFLTGLCLRTATGGNADFPSGNVNTNKSNLNTFLLGATAVNMANMLSAQLAAMELNVRHNFVQGSALVHTGGCGNTGFDGSFITISDLMTAAASELCLHGLTPSGNQYRAYQECLKNALDDANNNRNFVQPTPCSFHFAQ